MILIVSDLDNIFGSLRPVEKRKLLDRVVDRVRPQFMGKILVLAPGPFWFRALGFWGQGLTILI